MASNGSGGTTKAIPQMRALLPLVHGFNDLSTNSKYADVTIRCGERSWKAHKAIICPQSEFFAKACDADFKEREENVILLQGDDPNAVSALMHYFYHFEYKSVFHAGPDVAPVSVDVRIYVIADKYFVRPLQEQAKANITARLRTQWATSLFSDAIVDIYSLDPAYRDELKGIILEQVKQHPELFNVPDKYPHFHDALREAKEFAADAASVLATAANCNWDLCPAVGYKCPGCNSIIALSRKWPEVGNFTISCPFGCYVGLDLTFWGKHKVRVTHRATGGWKSEARLTKV